MINKMREPAMEKAVDQICDGIDESNSRETTKREMKRIARNILITMLFCEV